MQLLHKKSACFYQLASESSVLKEFAELKQTVMGVPGPDEGKQGQAGYKMRLQKREYCMPFNGPERGKNKQQGKQLDPHGRNHRNYDPIGLAPQGKHSRQAQRAAGQDSFRPETRRSPMASRVCRQLQSLPLGLPCLEGCVMGKDGVCSSWEEREGPLGRQKVGEIAALSRCLGCTDKKN